MKKSKAQWALPSVIVLFCAFALFACGQSQTPTSKAVKAELLNPEKFTAWKEAPLYDGTALLAADGACYWVAKDFKVFVCNGLGMASIALCVVSPQSVDYQAVEAAINGNGKPQPPHMGINFWNFGASLKKVAKAEGIDVRAAAQDIQHLPYRWVYKGKGGVEAEITVEEVGGMLTKAHAFTLIKKPGKGQRVMEVAENKDAVVVMFLPFSVLCPQEAQDALIKELGAVTREGATQNSLHIVKGDFRYSISLFDWEKGMQGLSLDITRADAPLPKD